MKKVFAILLILGAMGVVLSGCGGGDSSSTDTGTKAATAGDAGAKTPDAGAKDAGKTGN